MAAQSQMQNDKLLSVSALLSPPEIKRCDSFSSPLRASITQGPSNVHLPPLRDLSMGPQSRRFPPSPPISPALFNNKENVEECSQAEDNVKDPILFERSEQDVAVPSNIPLFPQQESQESVDSLVSRHVATNDQVFLEGVSKPTHEEYLFIVGVSQVMKHYQRNPKAWMERERKNVAAIREARRLANNPSGTAPRKIAPAPSSIKKQRSATNAPRVARVPRAPKRTPQTVILDSFESYHTPPAPKAPRAPSTRDDTDYQSLQDFAPSISTLASSNALKTEWKGQVLDLSTDPDRHMLHEAEVKVAATLRLSCATYLCSKRRIFAARIDCLRIGKDFRKTDAQQACKIDVNKASKLWSAYDKVGWFRRELFKQYL